MKKNKKYMNNKMVISTYISKIALKNEQTEQKQTQIQRAFSWLPDGRAAEGMGSKGEGIKKYKLVVKEQSWGCIV